MTELGDVFAALADPSRRKVVADLIADTADGEHACGSFELPVSKATRTHHFRVLRGAGLIDQRFHGNGSSVRLRRDDIRHRWPGLIELLAAETTGEASCQPDSAQPESPAQHGA
jgi:DNA-binding transcriptional ArsR family regulator